MHIYKVFELVSKESGISYRAMSSNAGRTPNYYAALKTNGKIPSVSNVAELLNACDYALCAVPRGKVDNTYMYEVTPTGNE